MKWIDCNNELPPDRIHSVLITDGEFISIGMWIHDPKNWYEPEDYENMGEFQNPHWNMEDSGVFNGIDQYMCGMEDISHWMPWPEPPKKIT